MTCQAGEFMLRCCARLLQVSTRSQKSDMSWQERERSVVSVSLISIDIYIPSMARRCIGKYVPGRGHGCSLTDQVLNKRQQRQAALASSSAHHQILTVFLLSKDMRGDGASHAHRSGTAARRRALCPASTNLTANRRPILRIRCTRILRGWCRNGTAR
jgi:hypothetical protein